MPNVENSNPLTGAGTPLKSVRKLCVSQNSSGQHYFIPDYQRGYRWEKREVTQLLSDLYEFMNQHPNQQEFYCLQPLVVVEREAKSLDLLPERVKEAGAVVYEVVDGQPYSSEHDFHVHAGDVRGNSRRQLLRTYRVEDIPL